MEKDFLGMVALVTGAASGIGRATAFELARHGAKVVLADMDVEKGAEAVRLIQTAAKGDAMFVRCDVAKSADVQMLVQRTVDHYGRLDVAFNNAGIEGKQAPVDEYPEDGFRRVLDVNLVGVWLCMKYEIPQMRKQEGGSIVNCSSILGAVGYENAAAYVAAKHGVVGLTQTAALENATKNIRVNAVCPGFIATPMLDRAGITTSTEAKKAVEDLQPMHRLGTSEEIAEAVLWLASSKASFVTGQALFADGGYTAR